MASTAMINRAVSDPVLRGVAQGYNMPPELVGTKIMPILPIQGMTAKLPQFGKEAFQIHDTKRGLNGATARLTIDNSVLTVATEEHSLEGGIDDTELLADHASVVQQRVHTMETVMYSLMREMEYDIASQVVDASNYASSNKKTVVATKRWDKAGALPIDDILEMRSAVRDAIGRYPNTIVMGAKLYEYFQKSPQAIERLQITKNKVLNLADISELVLVPQIYVGTEVLWNESTGKFEDIWKSGSNHICWIGWTPPAPGRNIPAFGYTVRNMQGMKSVRYRDESRHSEIIQQTEFWKPKILGAGAGALITVNES